MSIKKGAVTKTEASKKWQIKMQKAGRCTVCGKLRNISKRYCDEHLVLQREYTRNHRNNIKRYYGAKSYHIGERWPVQK